MKPPLKITIAGQAGTGKTTIALAIRECLLKYGFKAVTVNEELTLNDKALLENERSINRINELGPIQIKTKKLLSRKFVLGKYGYKRVPE